MFRHRSTQIMAILNATPDSFSGDGTLQVATIVAQAERALAQGAALLDLGAESTRPGATPVTLEEELRRIVPVVAALRGEFPDARLSIDTSKPEVFAAAAALGAQVLNLVRPLEEAHLAVVRDANAGLILTQAGIEPTEGIDAVLRSLLASAQRAVTYGIAPEQVMLDPGFGFGKTPAQNLALLGSLGRLHALPFASMLAASRKSTLGHITGRAVQEREFATAATTAMAAHARIDFVRVHDVAAAHDVLSIYAAVDSASART